jgi:cell division protein FtsI (penicillin-binding protein 3)
MIPGFPPGSSRPARAAVSRQRVLWLAGLAVLWALVILWRLVDLQVVRRDSLELRARRQHERTIKIAALRGRIVDRHGQTLAESLEVPSLYADPSAIPEPAAAAARLAPLLGLKPAEILRDLRPEKSFVWLAQKVSPATAKAVRALGIRGVGEIPDSERFYPGGRLAAAVLGYIGTEGNGLGGIESKYDEQIRGRSGSLLAVRDGVGVNVLQYLERPSSTGHDLELTLDTVIQYHAEAELERAMRETRSAWGSVVVLEPATGAILAMASSPSFNPNAFAEAPKGARRNLGVMEAYEPGSTFKVITAAAALERGLVRPEEVIDCGHGQVTVAGQKIRDHKVFDLLTFADVLAESSNVGAIRVGLRVRPEEFHQTILAFGFGSAVGSGLPGDSPGRVWGPHRWSRVSQASMSIGQELRATPLQVLRAVAAVGNRGLLPQPHILAPGADGPPPARRVITPSTAATLNALLERVVAEGTGKRAALPGYTVAGKTGTAQKSNEHGYLDEHTASFAGYVPSTDPRLAIIVVLDSPRGPFHGGEVAAPVFARIALPALRWLQVAPRSEPGGGPVAVRAGLPPSAERAAPPLLRTAAGEPVVPDVAGASARTALTLLARAGLTAHLEGTGTVVAQDPAAGGILQEGAVVRLLLSPEPAPADEQDPSGAPASGRRSKKG